MTVADRYKHLRSSQAFLIGLAMFIATWLAAHWLAGFDPNLSEINLILSTEASLSMALLMMVQDKTDAVLRQLVEQTLASVERVEDEVEQIAVQDLD